MPEDTQDLIINGSKISVGPRGSVSVQRCITFRDSTRLDLVTGLLPRHISRWISTLMHQGDQPVEEFCSDFHRRSTDTRRNSPALRSNVCQNLSERIKDVFVLLETPGFLEAAMSLAIHVDIISVKDQKKNHYLPY
ncbi:uncharacterized protein ACNLHF_026712 isoform 1-T1 [Anomaloglossus baeobatrachus]